jgi:hypothetical protein
VQTRSEAAVELGEPPLDPVTAGVGSLDTVQHLARLRDGDLDRGEPAARVARPVGQGSDRCLDDRLQVPPVGGPRSVASRSPRRIATDAVPARTGRPSSPATARRSASS